MKILEAKCGPVINTPDPIKNQRKNRPVYSCQTRHASFLDYFSSVKNNDRLCFFHENKTSRLAAVSISLCERAKTVRRSVKHFVLINYG